MPSADYVLDLIRRDLGLPSRREWFQRLATREPVNIPPGVSADMIRAERAEREARILRCPLVTADRNLSRAPGLGVPLVMV
jgi:hypothetical protein